MLVVQPGVGDADDLSRAFETQRGLAGLFEFEDLPRHAIERPWKLHFVDRRDLGHCGERFQNFAVLGQGDLQQVGMRDDRLDPARFEPGRDLWQICRTVGADAEQSRETLQAGAAHGHAGDRRAGVAVQGVCAVVEANIVDERLRCEPADLPG